MGNLSWIISITNIFLSFIFLTMAIELVVSAFKIKSYRWRSLLRILPFANLLFFNIGYFLNPLHCNSCMQNLFFRFNNGLKETLGEQNISLLRYSAAHFPNFPFSLAFYSFVAISLSSCLYKVLQIQRSIKMLHELIDKSEKFVPNIQNAELRETILKKGIHFYSTNGIATPMAAFNKTIFLPKSTMRYLSQEELEAVVAHEVEHLHWKDPLLKCGLEILSSIFWWVPTKWWFNRLELDQEMACDAAIQKYAIHSENMASGIVKGAKAYSENALLCGLASNCILQRIAVLLSNAKPGKRMLFEIVLVGAIIAMSMICMIIN